MNKQQKTYSAFIESICNKFNCPEMTPALKEGFQAYCEAIAPSYKPNYSIKKNIGDRFVEDITAMAENALQSGPFKESYKLTTDFLSDNYAESYPQSMGEDAVSAYERRITVDVLGDGKVIVNIEVESNDSTPSGKITLTTEHHDTDDSVYRWNSINPNDTSCENEDIGPCTVSLKELLTQMFAQPDSRMVGSYRTFYDEYCQILDDWGSVSTRDRADWWQ